MTELRGAHVIVTGGSQGIGAEFARQAAARGARVSLIARGERLLRETAEGIGPTARWRSADVADAASLATAVDELIAEQGPCDVLVCCAGFSLPGRFLEVPLAEFEAQVRVNQLGSIAAAHHVLPAMVQRGRGHVVFTSSTAGLMGVPGFTGYVPTKWAIRGFAEALRYEVEPRGIRVAVLYPPDTLTPGLAAENLRKPPETAAISASIAPVPAAKVAAALVRGIERNRVSITADATTRVLLRWGGVLEPLMRPSFRRTIARALRNADR